MEAIDKRQQLMQEQFAHHQQNNTTNEDGATSELYNSLQLEVKQLTKDIKEIWTDRCKVALHSGKL